MKMGFRTLAWLTPLALATAAMAQPAVFTDLGSITNPSVTTGTLTGFAAGQVQWLKVTVPSTIRVNQQFFDITLNGGTLSSIDTHMGIFDNAGTFIVSDDDDGPSNYSQLSFGDNTPARTAIAFAGNATANGATRAGADGATLAAGTYWISVTGFGGNTYANGWTVGTTHTATGDVAYRLELGSDTVPAAMSVTVAATGIAPAATPYMNGDQVRITATVAPFNGPPVNLNISATANLSAIGGSSTQTLFDDGSNGDLVAGDLVFSYVQTISGTTGGTTTGVMAVNVSDDASHTATANVTGLAITRYGNMGTPTTFTDMGTWSCAGNSSGFTHVDGGAGGPWGDRVRWYKIVLPAAPAGVATGSYVDLFTSNVGSVITDPEFAIFDNTGVKLAEDDQDGAASHAAMSFGQTTPTRAAQGDGAVHNGRDGALAGGTYWIAVGDFNINVPTTGAANGNWRVTSNDTTTTAGLLNLEVRAVTPACTVPPSGSGAIAGVTSCQGVARLMTVNVAPGTNPTSTGLAVTANLSAAGGSASQAFLDDGLNGDVTAGDNIFSFNFTPSTAGVFAAMPFTVTDAQARTAGGTFGTLTVNNCASGEPATFIDLGTLGASPVTNAQSYTAGQIRWYKFSVGAVSDPSAYLDIWTSAGAAPGTNTDTEIGLFDAAGTLINTDDDDSDVNYSAQSFGRVTPNRAAIGTGTAFNGRDGALAGGVYWLAVCEFSSTFASNWAVNVTPVDAGDITTNIVYFVDSQPTNPTGAGSGGVAGECGGNVLATVAVTGGLNPASTGLAVSLDTTALGGGSVAMLDNGTGGDVLAGDNIFSATVSVGGGADAVFALPFTITDAQARVGNGSLNVTRSASEIGDLPATAKTYYGASTNTIPGNMTPGDADMYAICINDTATFDATTIGGGPTFDSQLFLFNANGTGALMSDDDTAVAGFSRINAAAAANPTYTLASGGLYYIAVSSYNKDPITSATLTDTIWANQNNVASFLGTYGPNGVTPLAPIAGWTGGGTTTGAYTITMTGASTICAADLSGSTAGVPDCAVDINDLLFFLGAFEAGNADLDNGTGSGVRDCATDINDLLFFLVRFEAGC